MFDPDQFGPAFLLDAADCAFDDAFDASFDTCDSPVADSGGHHPVRIIRRRSEDPDELLALI